MIVAGLLVQGLPTCGFHVTQLSFNYDVSEKYNCLPFNKLSQEIEIRKRVILNKLRANVLGMSDIPNSSYSAKSITENYSV